MSPSVDGFVSNAWLHGIRRACLTVTLWGAFLSCGSIAPPKNAPQRVAVKHRGFAA